MAHRGIPMRRGQVRSYRGVRTHHVIWVVGMGLLLVLILVVTAIH